MEFQDYYKVLGVAREASPADIKKAYRTLAMKWHPDRHKGKDREAAEDRFKHIGEAYEVLSDAEKRTKYDQLGANWQQAGAGTGAGFDPRQAGFRTMDPHEFEQAFGGSGFSDFFSTFFGEDMASRYGRRGRRHARFSTRGADVQATLELPVSTAFTGGERSFDLDTQHACETCGGTGMLEAEHICPACGGVGLVRGRRSVSLKIPKGIRSGQVMRLKGLGEAGVDGGEAGDLHLTIELANDTVYTIEGDDVEAALPLSPWEAALGGKVPVRTPDADVVLTVPAGTSSGVRLRIRGHGLFRKGGGRGNFYVRASIVVPSSLTDEQRHLMEQLAATGSVPITGGARGAGS